MVSATYRHHVADNLMCSLRDLERSLHINVNTSEDATMLVGGAHESLSSVLFIDASKKRILVDSSMQATRNVLIPERKLSASLRSSG